MGLGTRGGGGTMFYKQKMRRGVGLQYTKYVIASGKYVNRPLSNKSMKFCIAVVHNITNDIGYNAKLNRSKISYFGVK